MYLSEFAIWLHFSHINALLEIMHINFYPFTGGILGIVIAMCQIEAVVIGVVAGLIVHLVTKRCVKQNLILGQSRNENTEDLLVPLYESVGLGGSTSESVEMQPSPAYQEASISARVFVVVLL